MDPNNPGGANPVDPNAPVQDPNQAPAADPGQVPGGMPPAPEPEPNPTDAPADQGGAEQPAQPAPDQGVPPAAPAPEQGDGEQGGGAPVV